MPHILPGPGGQMRRGTAHHLPVRVQITMWPEHVTQERPPSPRLRGVGSPRQAARPPLCPHPHPQEVLQLRQHRGNTQGWSAGRGPGAGVAGQSRGRLCIRPGVERRRGREGRRPCVLAPGSRVGLSVNGFCVTDSHGEESGPPFRAHRPARRSALWHPGEVIV